MIVCKRQVLHMIMGLERLERITAFTSEVTASPPTPLNSPFAHSVAQVHCPFVQLIPHLSHGVDNSYFAGSAPGAPRIACTRRHLQWRGDAAAAAAQGAGKDLQLL